MTFITLFENFFRFSDSLNLDTIVAIMLDYQRTQDWFYAFRWIPPRNFKNVLRSPGGFTFMQEYVYLTRRYLYPEDFESELGALNPQQYRKKYEELLSLAPKDDQLQNPEKYRNKKKTQRMGR